MRPKTKNLCIFAAVITGFNILISTPIIAATNRGGSKGDTSIIGSITLPDFFQYDLASGGLGKFLNNIFILITAGAGIFALFNFIMAGYNYMSAKDEKDRIEKAWAKIWQSVIGLAIVAGAFLIAALAGWILFGDPSFILKPKIYGPN